MRATKRTGFTLIELLVVIAIIAILAAILFPVFTRAKNSARINVCLNNLKQMGVGLQMYVDTSNGRFPWAGADSWNMHGTGSTTCWVAIKKYMKNDEVRWCPLFKANYPNQYKSYLFQASTTKVAWSYWYFCGHGNRFVSDYDTATSGAELCGYSLADVRAPGKKPAIAECGCVHVRGEQWGQWWNAKEITTYGIAYVDGHAKMHNCNAVDTILECYVRRDGTRPTELGATHRMFIHN